MSSQYSLKTRSLNKLRSFAKNKAIEDILRLFIAKKVLAPVIKKMIPNNYQYVHPTLREAQINNLKYQLDISDYLQHSLYYDLNTENYKSLLDLIKPGYIVLDVGVNFGHTILEIACRVSNEGYVYGFEPVPYLFEKASINISLNKFSNIKLINKAISSEPGTIFFGEWASTNSGGIQMSFTQNQNKVDAITIDNFIESESLPRLDLIKADIEGFEMEMLKGSINTLRKFKPILFLELNNKFLGRTGSSTQEVILLLNSLGYNVVNAESRNLLSPENNFDNTHIDVIAYSADIKNTM